MTTKTKNIELKENIKDGLPEDWVECKVGDLLKLKNGYAFKSSKYGKEGIPVIRIGDINNWKVETINAKRIAEDEEYNDHIVNRGDILIAMSGATTGKFGIYDSSNKAYQNQRVGNLIPHSKELTLKKFIYYLLYSLKREIERKAYGGAQPNISGKKIEELETKLFPLPIQRALVHKIESLFSSLDSGIADLKKAQEQLKIYRQAVLKKAFEGELTGTKFKRKKVTDFGIVKGGKRMPKNHKYAEGQTGFTYIMAGNLKNGTVTNELKYIYKKTFEALSNYKIVGGEVYITIVGACIGDAGIIPKDIGNAILTENAAKIIKLDNVYNKYLSYWINSEDCQNQIKKRILSATLGKLALSRIKTLEVPIPPIQDQHAIVQEIESRLSVCDAVEKNITESLEKAELLRQSILKKAFSGQLLTKKEIEQCKQEKDYEPADKLLERIKKIK